MRFKSDASIDFTCKKEKKKGCRVSKTRSCFVTLSADILISLHKCSLMAPKRDSWPQGPASVVTRDSLKYYLLGATLRVSWDETVPFRRSILSHAVCSVGERGKIESNAISSLA